MKTIDLDMKHKYFPNVNKYIHIYISKNLKKNNLNI